MNSIWSWVEPARACVLLGLAKGHTASVVMAGTIGIAALGAATLNATPVTSQVQHQQVVTGASQGLDTTYTFQYTGHHHDHDGDGGDHDGDGGQW